MRITNKLPSFIISTGMLLSFLAASTSCTSTLTIAALNCDSKPTAAQRSECKGLKMMTGKQKSEFHIQKSRNYLSNSQIQNSINSAKDAVKADPEYAKAYYNRGIAQMNNGDNNEAILSFNKSIEHNPRMSQAYYFKALMLEGLHNYSEAMDMYKKAIDLFPDYAVAHYRLGLLQKNKQELSEAKISLLKAYETWKRKLKYNPSFFSSKPDIKTAFYKTQKYLRGVGVIQKKSYFSYIE